MYVYVYIHIYIYIFTYTYTCLHTYIHISQPRCRNPQHALWQPRVVATRSQPASSQPRAASVALRLCVAKCSCRAMPKCVANLRCEPAF